MVSAEFYKYVLLKQKGRDIQRTVTPFSPPQATALMRGNNHLGILLHQLILRLLSPLILILFFILRPFFRVLRRLFTTLSVFPTTLQDDRNLLPTATHAPDPLLPHTRPTPLRPLHLTDPLGLAHPFVHMSIRLQPLEKLSTIPRREIRRFALLALHRRQRSRLLGHRCSGAMVGGLMGGEDRS